MNEVKNILWGLPLWVVERYVKRFAIYNCYSLCFHLVRLLYFHYHFCIRTHVYNKVEEWKCACLSAVYQTDNSYHWVWDYFHHKEHDVYDTCMAET